MDPLDQMPLSRLETLDHLPVNIAVLDQSGTIVAVNESWRRFGQENGLKDPNSCVGANYLDACRSASAPVELLDEVEDLLSGRRAAIARWYPFRSPDRSRWFLIFGLRDGAGPNAPTTLFHFDATELVGPTTIARLDQERPDWRPTAETVGHSIEAALARLLPVFVSALQGSETRRAGLSGSGERDEVRAVTKALTKKQFEVLILIGTGKSNAEIATMLSTSPNTVKLHVSAILKRLSLQTRAQAVLLGAKLDTWGV